MAENENENDGKVKRESVLQRISNLYPYLPQIAMGIVGIIAILAITAIIYSGSLSNLGDKTSNVARGLITFFVAMITVAIALILTLSAVLSNSSDYKERFALGKEILTIFIGILGTIVGFYFGSAAAEKPPEDNLKDKSKIIANSDVNAGNSNTNSNSNSNSNSAQTPKQTAVEFEKKGFSAIIALDSEGATQSFQEAYKLWADYHNVDEINKLLQKQKTKFASPDAARKNAAWQEVYCGIAKSYEWEMPDEILAKFKEKLKSQNYDCSQLAKAE